MVPSQCMKTLCKALYRTCFLLHRIVHARALGYNARPCVCLQVDLIVRPQLAPMDLEALSGWLVDLKTQSGQCTREFETARNWLKQVRISNLSAQPVTGCAAC